ncbi:MAG: hypothetical protein HY836_14530 [Aquabacterium sp.]|uniref:hypothetical protein n=1 Tax=Aquabacterium sp. TaxID=1872578 RepID=UPI0025BBDA10|nr:hypothetical protein [Aquabacterium sp.]MBI5926803.1 hypothetical protein [Aquabacterium sp.]
MTFKKAPFGWGLALAATLVLQACGGGGGGNPDTAANDPLAQPASVAHAQGVVYDASTGSRQATRS